MVQVTLIIPGRAPVIGPEKQTHHAALEWATGYAKPGAAFPAGTVARIGRELWAFNPATRRFSPLGA